MIVSAVVIPLLQSVITGLFSCAIVWSIILLIGLPNPRLWGELVGAFIALFSWLSYLDRFYEGLKAQLPPEKGKKEITVRVNAIQEDGHSGIFLDLPLDLDRFIKICHLISNGRDFSLGSLGGNGKPLSRSEFEVLRDYFISRGLAYWVNPHSHNPGVRLSPAGRGIIRHFAELSQNADTHIHTREFSPSPEGYQ
jgi:hypothetical protein